MRRPADTVGFDRVHTDVRRHPKARLVATFNTVNPMRIKVEMNTYERTPALPVTTVPYAVNSPWFRGSAHVATKIRALYQRREGRDLFDMWLAVEHLGLSPEAIASCFGPYRPEKWTPGLALKNLGAKLEDGEFRTDLAAMVPEWPDGYTIDSGAEAVRRVIAAVAP